MSLSGTRLMRLRKREAAPAKEPATKRKKVTAPPADTEVAPTHGAQLTVVPEDVLLKVLENVDAGELVALQRVSRQFCSLASQEHHWIALFEERFGAPSALTHAAADLAGGWKALYGSKVSAERSSAPWTTACDFEVSALVEALQTPHSECVPPPAADARTDMTTAFHDDGGHGAATTDDEEAAPLEVLFLIDGSGSVTEDDFGVTCNFIKVAGNEMLAKQPDTKLGIIQFSNEVRIEMALKTVSQDTFTEHVDELVRLNGGTNIAAAVHRAHRAFRDTYGPKGANRVVVLLTDGRVDAYQSREAFEKVARLHEQVPNVRMFALGVGRGVDKAELLRMITTTGEAHVSAESRFLALRTMDDSPW